LVALTVSLTVFQLLLLLLVSAGAGFFIRTKQIRKKQQRIVELENEMVSNHAEILKLQHELASSRKDAKSGNVPVVQIKADLQQADLTKKKNA